MPRRLVFAALLGLALSTPAALPTTAEAQDAPAATPSVAELSARDLRTLIRASQDAAERSNAVARLVRMADAGDRFAAQYMGDFLRKGEGVPPDLPRAVSYYRIAIDAGSGAAALALADMYLRGDAPSIGAQDAVGYYEIAVAAGMPRAMQKLGDLYRDGRLVGLDIGRAAELYGQAANLDYTSAAFRLADLHRDGADKGLDPTQAIPTYQALADAGDTTAMLRLGDGYRDGKFGAPDMARAAEYYRTALAAGEERAFNRLVDVYLSIPARQADGVALLEGRWRDGNGGGNVAVRLANAHLNGTGVPVDIARAVAILEEATGAGDVSAARRLIRLYIDGKGKAMPRMPKQAAKILAQIASTMEPEVLEREKLAVDAALAQTPDQLAAIVERVNRMSGAVQSSVAGQMGLANPNVYVAILQSMLAEEGLYSGARSGQLTQSTITAFNAFCLARDSAAQCRGGPLSSPARRFVRDVLEERG